MKKPRRLLLSEHREALDKIAAYLIRRETITGKEFMKIFRAVERGIEIPDNLEELPDFDRKEEKQTETSSSAGVSLSKEPLEKAEAAFEEQKISEECSEAAEENNTEA